MTEAISGEARRELVRAVGERYRVGTREEKRRILDEFVAVTGWHRKHAIRTLNAEGAAGSRRRPRPRLYDEAVGQALLTLWEASDRVCAKRLRPLLPMLVGALERHGHLQLDEGIRTRVLAASAATIDRLLAEPRAVARGGNRRGARARPALRGSVPVRTFADWKDPLPGCMEADLVAHCGDTVAGSFVHTLVLTDIASGWTECVPLLVREATLVVEALDRLRQTMPFVLRSFDTDNGSEFINDTIVAFCQQHGIEFTRSRPYRKNDQAWVEQKNGSIVRRLVGYGRLEGVVAAEALARLYAAGRLFVNFFQPSFKLAEKTRRGCRVVKRYHAPATPCARLLATPPRSARRPRNDCAPPRWRSTRFGYWTRSVACSTTSRHWQQTGARISLRAATPSSTGSSPGSAARGGAAKCGRPIDQSRCHGVTGAHERTRSKPSGQPSRPGSMLSPIARPRSYFSACKANKPQNFRRASFALSSVASRSGGRLRHDGWCSVLRGLSVKVRQSVLECSVASALTMDASQGRNGPRGEYLSPGQGSARRSWGFL